jgi:hypothetical protein
MRLPFNMTLCAIVRFLVLFGYRAHADVIEQELL